MALPGHPRPLRSRPRRLAPPTPAWGALLAAAFVPLPPGTGPPVDDPTGVLARYPLEAGRAVALPSALVEISGLTVDPSGRLFAHHDEAARVYELDPERGRIRARFAVGRGGAGDYEGIAAVGERLFMVDSDGTLLEFRSGRDGTRVPGRSVATGAGRLCEIEGLGYDPGRARLLLGCKTARVRALEDDVVLLAFSLATMRLEAEPALRVSRTALADAGVDRGLDPSAVAVHPATGTILVAAGRQAVVVELSPIGEVLGRLEVPERVLPQLEGIAVGTGGTLFLASEGAGGGARLVRIPMAPAGEAP